MRFFLVFLSLILPGWGHIWMGFCQRGVLLFTIFITLANGIFLSLFVWIDSPRYVCWSLVVGTSLVWIYIVKDIFYLAIWRPSSKWQKYIKKRLERAILAYLKNDYVGVLRDLKKVLKKDRYSEDCYFYLGLVYFQQKQPKKALFYFQKCILLDHQEKWSEAIQRFYEANSKKEKNES